MNNDIRQNLSAEELNSIFVTACEQQANRQYDSAISHYLELLKHFPDAPILLSNLGLTYYEKHNFEDALVSFIQAAKHNPEDMDILFNLALCQKRSGDIKGAIKSYSTVLVNDPESIDTLYNLGGCFKDIAKYKKAIEIYTKVLWLDPDHLSATNNLAYVYQRIGKNEQAVIHYEKVLEINPDHEAAKHMFAALTGSSTKSSPEQYVREVFDNYSNNYEQSLVSELEYDVPAKIRTIMQSSSHFKAGGYGRGLDLGCGTGLSGESFYDLVDKLDGIDLAPKMVALAEEKRIYNKLYSGSIIEHLQSTSEHFDFFLAADVFGYIGDLEEVFRLLRSKATSDIMFCFSTEKCNGDGFKLRPTGRFAHSHNYVTELSSQTRWQILARESTSLRKEKGQPVMGDLWFLTI